MLLIAEVVLLIYGIHALITAKFTIGKKKLIGARARVLGGICMVPLPVSFAVGFTWGFLAAINGEAPPLVPLLIIDMLLIVATLAVVTFLGSKYLREQAMDDPQFVNAGGPGVDPA